MLVDKENIIEKLIVRVGGANTYQYRMFAVMATKWLISAMFLMSLNFLFYTEDFVCRDGENGQQNCQDWVCQHDEKFWRSRLPSIPKTLSYQFGMFVCSKQWVISLIQSVCYWGSFVGFLVFPMLADNYGRKWSENIAWWLAAIGSIILACSFNIIIAAIGLFLCGLGCNSAINLHYTFIKEHVIGKTRDIMIISLQITFSIGVCAIAAFALFLTNWRLLTIFVFTLPMTLLLLSNRYIEETPQFLIKKGRQHFLQSLNRMARINQKPQIDMDQLNQALQLYSRDESKLTFIDLFRFKSIRLTSYCCGFVNMAIEFIYDGTLFSLDRIGLNLYLNQIVIGAAEVFAALYANIVVIRVKRKWYTILCLSLIACFLLVFVFTGFNEDDDNQGQTAIIELIVLIALRFTLSSLWGFYFVYLSQLYPSQITSISYGYMSAVGTLAATLSPYIRLAAKEKSMILMSGMSFLAAGHVFCLRETKGTPTRLRILEREQAEKESTITI